MSNIKYVAYLSKSDSGSACSASTTKRRRRRPRRRSRCSIFTKLSSTTATSARRGSRGIPSSRRTRTSPRVGGQQGHLLVATWAKQPGCCAGGPGGPGDRVPALAAARSPCRRQTLRRWAATSAGRAVVSDDLYQSHMPYKAGSTGTSSNKVTSSEIAEYRSQRGGSS